MSQALILAFLFCTGSCCGWAIELLFRRFVSRANPERRWINPGFLTGPYVPLYGFGLVILYLLASLENFSTVQSLAARRVLLFLSMAVSMTLIEYLAGLLCERVLHVRLWDYSGQWGNVQGLICPLFSFFWALLGAAYYFLVHPHILSALDWLSRNLAFSFFIGAFYGVFFVDLWQTLSLAGRIRRFAQEHEIIVRYEELKRSVRRHNAERRERVRFLFALRSGDQLREQLEQYLADLRAQSRARWNKKK